MNNEKILIIANRYAESLLKMGKSNEISDAEISDGLSSVIDILSLSKELYSTLINPLISLKDKENIIENVFKNDVDRLVINFLKLLVQNDRFEIIYDIANIYKDLLNKKNNIVDVEVISAIELSLDDRNRISEKLSSKLNKQINVKYNTSESVIAGFVVKMGDDVIDTSVAHKLEEYKKILTK
ncbi:ATP synthase F1 subunit delta [bacterium]|nr:ATP synthase F1 subunit delta [bacterium]